MRQAPALMAKGFTRLPEDVALSGLLAYSHFSEEIFQSAFGAKALKGRHLVARGEAPRQSCPYGKGLHPFAEEVALSELLAYSHFPEEIF